MSGRPHNCPLSPVRRGGTLYKALSASNPKWKPKERFNNLQTQLSEIREKCIPANTVSLVVMSYLEVHGASLYYESIGRGPLLLCISGANGDADVWRDLANCLKERFTVVAYDRQ